MAKKENKRVCGFCQEGGHNIRSCKKKKASEAVSGNDPERVAAAPSSSTALMAISATSEMTSADTAPSGVAHLPISFRADIRQEHVNGTTLRLDVREFDSGLFEMTLRFQREATGAKDIKLDFEVAAKLYEMLGHALQKQVAQKRGEVETRGKPNGLKQQEAR